MEGQNILYGNIDDLRNVHGALEAQAAIRNQIASETSSKQNLNKDIEAEEKLLREKIETTIKKRREQVVSNFDKEMSKAQDRLKKTRNDRSRAKNKGIETRIKEETADKIQENKNLRDEIRTIFRQKGVWKYLDNKLTYMLYYPKSAKEKGGFLIIAALALVVFPTIAVRLTNVLWIFEFLEYIIVAGIFTGLYILGYRYTRINHRDAFAETKIQRATMLKNEAKIKRIKKSIKRDKDDDRYGLSHFDDDIKELESHINDIVTRKNEALSDFEKTTKSDIEEEITSRDIDKIDKLKKQLSEVNLKLKELEEKQKNITLNISTNYTAYIGEENMNIDRIEKMIVLLGEGRAKTIGDAINILKNTSQQL